eukprot:TRINITY_DN46047_c0_g1_i1.p1 TRINITY_DN46047_c0_g1~~TRINITY_DN46047_c0_g1_i1.p1  ORF type:complete len:800 (-),score=131.96 TRINITY_DN46047_c0_g1_i1:233-2632(-)
MDFRERVSEWSSDRTPRKTQARGVVPLPSLSFVHGGTFYKEALAIVRQRKAALANEDEDSGGTIVSSYRPRTPLQGHGTAPKYLRLACVLHRPLPPSRPRPPPGPRIASRMLSPEDDFWLDEKEPAGSSELPNLYIAEANLAVNLRTHAGEVHVPPHVWLVLGLTDEAQAANIPVAPRSGNSNYSEAANLAEAEVNAQAKALLTIAASFEQMHTRERQPLKEGELSLCSEAGGGTHASVVARSVPLLRLVSEDRLSLTGAEANFQRCARGASILALRHAAYLLKIVVTRQALEAQAGRPLPEDKKDDANSAPPPLTLEEIDAKVTRVAGMVASRAAANSQRAASQAKAQAAKMNQSADSPNQTPRPQLTAYHSPRPTTLQKGFNALLDFLQFGARKFGNAVRLWFALDPEENMRIAEKQFARACEDIGFRGNIVALWRHLNRDGSGQVSLIDVDSQAAILLADFKVLLEKQFDNSLERFMKFVDLKKSNRVARDEFVRAMQKLPFQGSGKRLFDLICRFNCGAISLKDLQFLHKWSPPLYLFSKGDQLMLDNLLGALKELHQDNMLRAWFKSMDTDQTMRVSWTKFNIACAKIPRQGRFANLLPKTDKEVAAVWRTLDEDCSGWIALREFSQDVHEAAAAFKNWCDRTHGGIAKFVAKLQSADQGVQKVSKAAFRKALVQQSVVTSQQANMLFDGLDIADTQGLGEQDVKFLDKWDLVWEEWEGEAHLEGGAISSVLNASKPTKPDPDPEPVSAAPGEIPEESRQGMLTGAGTQADSSKSLSAAGSSSGASAPSPRLAR